MLRRRRISELVTICGILIASTLLISPLSAEAGTGAQGESVSAFQIRAVDADATARTLDWLRTSPTSPRTPARF